MRTTATVNFIAACAEAMNMLPEYGFEFILSDMSICWFANPKGQIPMTRLDENETKMVENQMKNFMKMAEHIKNYDVYSYESLNFSNFEISSWVEKGGKTITICDNFKLFSVLDKFDTVRFKAFNNLNKSIDLLKYLENKSKDSKTKTIIVESKYQITAFKRSYPEIFTLYNVVMQS